MNSDIMFDDSLLKTLDALLSYPQKEGKPDLLTKPEFNETRWSAPKGFSITGQRLDIDVPKSFIDSKDITGALNYAKMNGALFSEDAQDFFILPKDIPIDWGRVPPWLMGGVAYDNW